jgi:N-acetylglucosamine-6-phosphate deacetylase
MIKAVSNCINEAGIEFDEALRMASLYPARAAQLHRFGKIEEGYRADLVLLSNEREIKAVIRNGIFCN